MLKGYFQQSVDLSGRLMADPTVEASFSKMVEASVSAITNGGKILAAGNGGSAADAQHFTAEFVAKYKLERRAYQAIALTTDASVLTAIGNDYDYSQVFRRQVEAFGRKGDILFLLTTSGNSTNLISAIEQAKKQGVITAALLGRDGGKTKGLADIEIIIPSDNTPRIQEAQKLILHSIAEEVEKRLVETIPAN
jgi:D-sedoheptulose 7-phosphate isomerase